MGEDMLLGWGGPRLPIFSPVPPSCRQCQQDAALWQTLHLDQSVSLDELLNISQVSAGVPWSGGQSWGHRAGTEGTVRSRRCAPLRLSSLWQYTEEISTAFEKLNITLSPITLLSQSQRDLLLNASRAGQPPNFTHTLEQVGWGQPGVEMGRCVQMCVEGVHCSLPFAAVGVPPQAPRVSPAIHVNPWDNRSPPPPRRPWLHSALQGWGTAAR